MATVKLGMWTRDSYTGYLPEIYTSPSFLVDQERAPGIVLLFRHTSVEGRCSACLEPGKQTHETH